jgi:hypothetical protein
MRTTTTRSQDHTGAFAEGGVTGDGRERRGTSAIDRVGAFAGAAYAALALLSGALIGEGSNAAGSPGQRILDEQQRIAENPWTGLAFAMIILAQLSLMVFVGYLCSRVRDAGWFATTALVGGISLLIANLMSATIVIGMFVVRDDLSPELARALEDLDGAGHLVQLLPLGVFALFASAAALVTRTLGRVLGWAGIAIGATSIVTLAATGLPANEDFFLWPFLLVLLWIVVLSLRFGFARNRKVTSAAVAATEH